MTDMPTDLPIESQEFGKSLDERLEARININVPDRRNPQLKQVMEIVNNDDELYALWTAANVTAMERLGMTDHGPVHVKIVMNIAVRMLRLLLDHGVEPSVAKNYGMSGLEAEVVVALAALLHDLGMSIHRQDHEGFSLFIAQEKLREILPQVYDPVKATILRSEILHAIIGHRSGGMPLTLEGGVVRIADALDMAKGRSRIPFESGSVSIHSISAAAIEAVTLGPGETKPVRISIEMTNSAGIFQVDQLLRNKLKGSGIEPYVELDATLKGEEEKRLFRPFRL